RQGTLREYLNNPERLAILRRVIPMLREPEQFCLSDEEFNDLALQLFRYQFARCAPFRRLVESSGGSEGITDYRDIAPVPTEAFKLYRMTCFDPWSGEISFQTSGTTSGRPGTHVMPTPNLY